MFQHVWKLRVVETFGPTAGRRVVVGSAARSLLLLLPVKSPPGGHSPAPPAEPHCTSESPTQVEVHCTILNGKLLRSDTSGWIETFIWQAWMNTTGKFHMFPICIAFTLIRMYFHWVYGCVFGGGSFKRKSWGNWISNRWEWSHIHRIDDCRRGISPHEVYHRPTAKDFVPLSVVFLRFATLYFVICCGHSVCTEYLEASKTALLFGFAV